MIAILKLKYKNYLYAANAGFEVELLDDDGLLPDEGKRGFDVL